MKEKKGEKGTIWEAIENDDQELLKNLLTANPYILREVIDMIPALLYISHKDAINCLKYIVEEVKINILNITDIIGANIFHVSAEKRGIKVFKYILDKKIVNIDSGDDYEWNALHYSAKSGHNEIIKILLETGCNKNPSNKHGDTPLHLAAYRGNTEAVQLLLDTGCDLNLININGETPLHEAVKHGKIEIVKLLLNYGCKKNSRDNIGNTAFHLAAFFENPEIIKLLVESGFNLEFNHRHETPLDYIIEKRNLPIFNYLAEKLYNGTLLTPFSNLAKSPFPRNWLIKAVQVEEIEMVRYIFKRGTNKTDIISFSIPFVLEKKNWDIFLYLCDSDPLKINTPLNSINSLDELLTGWGVKPIKWLLDTKVIEINFKNKDNKTLLDLALAERDLEKIKYLFEKNCLLSLKNLKIDENDCKLARSLLKKNY